ncbi:MAG: tetratricopeptide repeat protein [Holophagales bacterium]|nr:tetratricopeptide repeat protein [Holophagales bacterium]
MSAPGSGESAPAGAGAPPRDSNAPPRDPNAPPGDRNAPPRDRSAPPRDPALARWSAIGLGALAVVVVAVPLSLLRAPRAGAPSRLDAAPAFAGTAACRDCHKVEYGRWLGSDHDRAMEPANDQTVLGDFSGVEATFQGKTSRFYRKEGKFFVDTDGPDGTIQPFEITYTFGWDPLQQYLVPFPGGRLQTLAWAWDLERRRWFHMYPDRTIPPGDWLHWTRNGQNWNGMCAECHSTNLIKGFDPATQTYDTTWSDIDVGCEACHGPGSRHVAWAEIPPMGRPELANTGLVVTTSDISPARLVELCAPCHSRRAELGDYDHTSGEMLDRHLPSLLVEGLYYPDGQILDEVYVYGSFLQSKMYARGVSCRDCHDVHGLKLHREGNDLCLQCHQREVFDSSEHHFHKKVVDGRPSPGALCIKCHMPESVYMVIDWRADHSLRLPRPDLSLEIGAPNACSQSGCHDDKPLQWAVDAHRKWYGVARRPHYGTTFAKARRNDPSAVPELVRLAESELTPAIVRATALQELGRFPGDSGAAALEAALQADDALLRQTAVAQLRVATGARLIELVAPLLSDPVRAVRLAAVSRLAGAPPERLKSYQREAFDHDLAEYRESVAYSADFASAGLNLGNLERALGNPDAAERAYRQALAIDDLFFPAKQNLAVLFAGEGRTSEAAGLLAEIVAAYPDNADALYSLGLALVELGRPEEAAERLARAVALRPGEPRWRYNLGLLLQELGRLDDAERELRAAVDLDPTNFDLLLALADHELRRGKARLALELADRMIAVAPDAPLGHQFKALAESALDSGR